MAEDIRHDSTTLEHVILVDRRNKHRRTSDSCDDITPDCAATFANLEIRVQVLEKFCEKIERRIALIHNSVAKLHQIKQMVMAWAVAAGTIASFIYSNLSTIRDMFR